MKRTIIEQLVIAGLVLLAATGCNSAGHKAQDSDESSQGRAVRVTDAVAVGENGGGIEIAGVVQAQGQVKIAFQLGGLVTGVLVDQGDHVTAGQVLARLDSVPYSAQRNQASGAYQQAQAMLSLAQEGARSQEIAMAEAQVRSATAVQTQAEADFQRITQLYAEGVVAKQQMDAAESGYKQACEGMEAAQEQLAMAREGARPQEIKAAQGAVTQAGGALSATQRQLEYATLRAPSDGTIVWRNIEKGMTAAPGVPVFEIANLESLQIETEIPETDLARLQAGAVALAVFPALPDITCKAVVVNIAPQAQTSTRGFPVKLSLIDPDPAIVPGIIALIEYEYQALPGDSVRIPRRCIVDGSVFVVESNHAIATPVTVLMDKGEYAYIEGIAPGDKVMINGQHYVKDGDPVTVVDALAIEEITELSAE